MRVERDKKYGSISERARKIEAAYRYISAKAGVEPLCAVQCLRGVSVILKPHLRVKLMELS